MLKSFQRLFLVVNVVSISVVLSSLVFVPEQRLIIESIVNSAFVGQGLLLHIG